MAARLGGRSVCAFCSRRLTVRSTSRSSTRKLHLQTHAPASAFSPLISRRDAALGLHRHQIYIDSRDMPLGQKLDRQFLKATSREFEIIHGQDEGVSESHTSLANSTTRTDGLQSVNTRQDHEDLALTPTQKATIYYHSFPFNGQCLPNGAFRTVLANAYLDGPKLLRKVISEQLLRCQNSQDITRLAVVTTGRKVYVQQLANSFPSIIRALYRSRNNSTDAQVLASLNIILVVLKRAQAEVHQDLLALGAKFSARTRSLRNMKRYLRELKKRNVRLTREQFRTLVAKCSVGRRGLGEIRNGRWLRPELLQVMLGFEDVGDEEPYHLETFLIREDWPHLHCWLTLLARCRAIDQLYREWDLWLVNPGRTKPRPTQGTYNATTRIRGDYWFIEQFCHAGDIAKSWEILRMSEIPFAHLPRVVQSFLLSEPENVTVWSADVKRAMLRKYEEELAKIEAAVGAQWVGDEPDGSGQHLITASLDNETWEALCSSDFFERTPPGYPWESESLAARARMGLDDDDAA